MSQQKSKKRITRLKDCTAGWNKITEMAKQLKFKEELRPPECKRFKRALAAQGGNSRDYRSQKMQRFLSKVHEINYDYFVLCAVAFSQNEIGYAKAVILKSLIEKIASDKDNNKILGPQFRSYVAQLQRSEQLETRSAVKEYSQEVVLSATGEIRDEAEISFSDISVRAESSGEVLENASYRGVTQVFGRYMRDAIRRTTVDHELKAAITMVFPDWVAEVQCLMSLDICANYVVHLAQILFKAEVRRVEDVLHISRSGFTIITPFPEATLKGVSKEAIVEVFGNDILEAINDCPIRKREVTEGKSDTECVSMILAKNGAIINLSLNLERGFELKKQLYD